MNKKVLITVAPVSHFGKPVPNRCNNPLKPEEIAEEVIACAEKGAGMVHLHVRDEKGRQTSEMKEFSRTLDLITAGSDIVIQGSTGGLAELSLEERSVCLTDPRVEVASLNMGSINFGEEVYINTLPDIRYWAKRMKETLVVPELECFDVSMVETSIQLANEGVLERPLHFNFCFGIKGALKADMRNLTFISSLVETGAHWGLTHDGMVDFSFLAGAIAMGTTVLRVGFEDSFYYRQGKIAEHNSILVEEIANLVISMGGDIMTPSEYRELLGS
ncbi:MAG: 3-keto-5-aminohexanoate cleavage protein [Bacteroidales bacterium]|nr:3-keto-5-aminohexanoate cleavage protein [Bacteroidales bacterium]MBN2698287.1 3-keto-5-aminohexanoate cleavage protein [Bacteroidales bacterium]